MKLTCKLLAAVFVLSGTLGVQAVHASTLAAQYFSVSYADPDFNNPVDDNHVVYTNLVKSTLGPDGLPVYNASYGGPVDYDVNGNGELTWWDPADNSHVIASGTGTITLPYDNPAMYPPAGNGPNDSSAFLTAMFTGVLIVPQTEQVTFNLGSDDDSFLFVNRILVDSVGGVHPDDVAPATTTTLAPGSYDLSLFYADRHPAAAKLTFSIETSNVSSSSAPEPSTIALLGAGLAAVIVRRRRRAL